MLRKHYHHIEWLEFEVLADLPFIKHALFLRHGGKSQGPYASLNLGMHVQDDVQTVESNLELIKNIFRQEGPAIKQMTWAKGCHGYSIAEVTADSPREVIDHDALVTTSVNHLLMTTHADCQIGLIVDPIRKVVANIHSGWRGNSLNIYGKAIAYMQERYHSGHTCPGGGGVSSFSKIRFRSSMALLGLPDHGASNNPVKPNFANRCRHFVIRFGRVL